ncbi:Cof-type HAD-IIB family hydrolase, partial [Pseudomonas syringae pv. tagetis]
ELFSCQDVAILVFAYDQWLLLDPDGDYVDHDRDALGYDYVQVECFESYLDRVDKIVAEIADFDLLKNLEVLINTRIEGL